MKNCYLFWITLFVILSWSLLVTSNTINPKINKIIIDTDAGSDDAVAILLVLAAKAKQKHNFEIAAITCVYGNTEVNNVAQNVLKILTVANRSDIAVYKGATKPLIYNYTDTKYFGNDGFGDFKFNQEITAKVKSKHAAIALVEIARKYAGELSILSLGPLTNIALAIELDPSFVKNVNNFYLMGGCVHGVGGIRPNIEFNFGMDPESNFILFNSILKTASIIMLPRETSLYANISKNWRNNILGISDSNFVKFLNKVEAISLSKSNNTWKSPDAIAAATMLWPELGTKTITVNVNPVTDGAAKGSVLVDYSYATKKLHNTKIIDAFEVNKFLQILQKYL